MSKREKAVYDLAVAVKAVRLPYSLKNPLLYAAATTKATRKVVSKSMDVYGCWIGVVSDDPQQQRWLVEELLVACGLPRRKH